MSETKHTPGTVVVLRFSGHVLSDPNGDLILREDYLRVEAERDHLREVNAELVTALEAMLIIAEAGECEAMHPDLAESMARAALAKANKARGKA